MNVPLIRRMIKLDYTNQEIINRIRTTNELIEALRKLIDIENEAKLYTKKEDDWDE
jgi:hypothetical protein